jgi:hypothetical protein
MVNTKTIILGAAVLALAAPGRVFGAAEAAGEVGRQLGSGISALGSVQIRPALAPEFAPRFAPEIDLPSLPGLPDFSTWWEKGDDDWYSEPGDVAEGEVHGPPEEDVVSTEEDDYVDP